MAKEVLLVAIGAVLGVVAQLLVPAIQSGWNRLDIHFARKAAGLWTKDRPTKPVDWPGIAWRAWRAGR